MQNAARKNLRAAFCLVSNRGSATLFMMEQGNIGADGTFDSRRCGDSNFRASEHM
jgi:hypothetical protein